MEKLSECNIRFTDSADNFVSPKITLRSYLEEKRQYLSWTYFVVHSRCDIFDFINSENNGEGDHNELNEPNKPNFKHTTFQLEPQSSSSTQRSDILFAPSHSFASRNEYLTTTTEPAGQSLIPSQGSPGIDEGVVTVGPSCHETTTIPKRSTADMTKSGIPVSVTANPNIEQDRDTAFPKISQNFLAQPNYTDATQRWVEQLPITLGEEENNYLGIDGAENPTTSPGSIVQNRDDIVTTSSNNVQFENDVSPSAENNTSGNNGNENNVAEIIILVDTEPYQQEEINLVTTEATEIEIHRLILKNDIIKAFKNIEMNQKVKFKIYDHTEKLEDVIGVGVDRDIYASVWLEIMDSLFVGASERRIYVRHDLYFEAWEALGNLLLHGFTSCAYFPI